jgi:hypothetical protein
MKRLALAAASLLLVAVPSFAADLDGPVYRERHSYAEPPPPVIVERHDYYYDDDPDVVFLPRAYGPDYGWWRHRWHRHRHFAYGGWPVWRHRPHHWRHRHHHHHRRW